MLHKLRRAMVCPERERLSGAVEVDEAYVGGNEPGVHGRQTEKKAIVAIAVEVHEPRGFGRVRLRRVPDASASSLLPFVREAVACGAEVRTDGWGGYSGLAKHGYVHSKTVLSSSGDPAHVSMPAVHRVASLLKRWLLGTHQGAVRPDQLDRYLDEFTFRFNRRSSRSRGLLASCSTGYLSRLPSPVLLPIVSSLEADPDSYILWLVELNGYPPRLVSHRSCRSSRRGRRTCRLSLQQFSWLHHRRRDRHQRRRSYGVKGGATREAGHGCRRTLEHRALGQSRHDATWERHRVAVVTWRNGYAEPRGQLEATRQTPTFLGDSEWEGALV